MQARSIGPATMSGRITSIDALHSDPRLVYIGTASGGVICKPVFDKHTMSIGSVCLDQQRPDTVWVGTGESWTRNSLSIGNGVYRSTDGGEKWKLMVQKFGDYLKGINIKITTREEFDAEKDK